MLYAVAYVARCFGKELGIEEIRQYREETRKLEFTLLWERVGLARETFWQKEPDMTEVRRFWLGPTAKDWVAEHLNSGAIGLVQVNRISTMAHALVALGATETGVFVMDPIYGHKVEPWDWFLGSGPGTHGAHHIECWIRAGYDNIAAGSRWSGLVPEMILLRLIARYARKVARDELAVLRYRSTVDQ